MLNEESRDFEEMTVRYIYFVSENARPTALKMDELIEATLREKELNLVKSQLNGERLTKDESSRYKNYEKMINELSISKEEVRDRRVQRIFLFSVPTISI